jgi:hypothetical protein
MLGQLAFVHCAHLDQLMRRQSHWAHLYKLMRRLFQTMGSLVVLQVPTQNFFTDDFGLPLTMKPDFQTLSCEMIFGQQPPPIDQDEAYTQSCLSQCSLAKGIVPCPKTDTARPQEQQQLPAAAAGSGSSI